MANRHLITAAATLLLLTGCKEKISPAEAASHLKTAQDLYAQKDYPHALTEVQAAIKGNPASGDAHYLAAQIHEGMKNQQAAFQEYARAALPEANNMKAQLKVVEMLVGANQLDTALGRINATLGSHPGDPDALSLRAVIEQGQGSREKARVDAQAAVARNPGQPIANTVLAGDALQDKNADKALAIVATGLKAHPDNVALLRLKAAALQQQGKTDDAVAIYENLVKADPSSIQLRTALAGLDAGAGRIDQGEQVLREAVKAAPGSSAARIPLVAYLGKYRDEATADAELRAGIAAAPQDSTLDLLRADQLVRAGKPDEAAEALGAAAGRVPDGPARAAAQLALARLDAEQGRDSDARKLLDEILTAKPDNDDALQMRAALMLRDNDAAHAVTDLLAVASRHPRDAAPFAMLAEAYRQQGDSEKAVDALKKVIFFEPANLSPVTALADLDLRANKPDLAKQALAEFVARNPDDLPGRVASVRLAVQQNDWPGAQALIDQMRRNPIFTSQAAVLNAELLEAKGQPAAAMPAFAKILDDGVGRPVNRDALAGYVRTAAATKQFGPAAAYLPKFVDKAATPDDAAVADLALAALFKASGDDAKATEARAAAMQAAPKQAGTYLDAASNLRRDQPDAAVAVLNQGLANGAPAEPLLMARATLEDEKGDKAAAVATYGEVLKINPRSVPAANNYASLAADAMPQDKALLTEARRPLQRFASSSNPAILDTLAWLDYRLGDYQAAKDLLTRAKADTSESPQLRFHYGAVLIALGDKDAGRTALKGALGQPDFPGHAEAQRLMTE